MRWRKWFTDLRQSRAVAFLEKHADALPSRDQESASRKRIRYCQVRLRDAATWRISKQIVEVRLIADERTRLMAQCESHARRVDAQGKLPARRKFQ